MADQMTWTAEALADALNGKKAKTKRTTQGFMALCPAHNDKNPSLSIRETESGRLLLKCFAGCANEIVHARVEATLSMERGALGKARPGGGFVPKRDTIKNTRAEVIPIVPVPADAPRFDRNCRSKKHGSPKKVWTYYNERGEIMGYVARYEEKAKPGEPAGKVVWPWVYGIREGKREWCVSAMPDPRPLYNLPELLADRSRPVLIHEGEPAADAGKVLLPLWTSTTTVGGGNAPHLTDLRPLAGRQCILSPDFDIAGVAYIAQMTQLLKEVGAAEIHVLRFPVSHVVEEGRLVRGRYYLQQGDDMADHLKRGWTREMIQSAVAISGLPLTYQVHG